IRPVLKGQIAYTRATPRIRITHAARWRLVSRNGMGKEYPTRSSAASSYARKILARTPGRVYLRDTHRPRHAEVVVPRSPRGRLVFPALADPFQRLTPSVIATVAASLLA